MYKCIVYPIVTVVLLTGLVICSILVLVVFPIGILVKLILQECVVKPLQIGIQNVINRQSQENY
jgi:sulfite exporter TauE/SafE